MNSKRQPAIRLYVPGSYTPQASLALSDAQTHYLHHVMRLKAGAELLVFNGTDGEWRAKVQRIDKKGVTLELATQARPQDTVPDLWLAFAPIKHHSERLVEKAVELGVAKIIPVRTQRTIVGKPTIVKWQAHAVEAAEQCERLSVPEISEIISLPELLADWNENRALIYADEAGSGAPLNAFVARPPMPACVLIGPEGGFAPEEQALLKACAFVHPVSLGPRILRADTAAIVALGLVQSAWGDWNIRPQFKVTA